MTMLEQVARAMHEREDSWSDTAWEYLPEGTQDLFVGQATAALTAALRLAKEGGTHLDPVVYEHAGLFLEAILEDS